jgi:putative ABC transport system permease protein
LKNKNQIIISDKLAKKYFGSDKVLGKPITQMLDSGKVKEYSVTGVFREPPSNSSFDGSAYVYFDNQFDRGDPDYNENGWSYRSTLFVQVKDAGRIANIENSLTNLYGKQ